MDNKAKRKLDDIEHSNEDNGPIKRAKISRASTIEPSLADLPNDSLLYVLDYVGLASILKLATTCKKLLNIIQVWLRSSLKKIYAAGFDEMLPGKLNEAVAAIAQARKIESIYACRVKITTFQEKEIVKGGIRSRSYVVTEHDPTKALVQLLPWDNHKIALVSSDSLHCSIVCSESGKKLCTISVEYKVQCFASSKHHKIAFVIQPSTNKRQILVYSIDTAWSASLVGKFAARPNLTSIGWTDKDELLLVHPNSSDLRTTTGEVIRTKDYNQPYNSIVVSPDGRFLIRIAMNEVYQPASIFKENLATGNEQMIFQISSICQGLMFLQFVGNDPDLIYWHIVGTDQGTDAGQFFLFNLRTNSIQYHSFNIYVNDISRNGTKVLERNESMDMVTRSVVCVPPNQIKINLDIPEEIELPSGGYFQTTYHWTNPNGYCGINEKLLAMRHESVSIIDPLTGTHVSIKNMHHNELLKFCAVSRDNRTVVFERADVAGGPAKGILVWHLSSE